MKCIFNENRPFCVFEAPSGKLGATYGDHLRLIGKRVVDFLLALIELFFTRCYGWGATSDYRFKIGDFAPTGTVDPKFQVEGVAPTNYSSQKTRLNYLSYGIKKSGRIFLPFCHNPRLWQADRGTEFSSLDRICIPCSAVNMSSVVFWWEPIGGINSLN